MAVDLTGVQDARTHRIAVAGASGRMGQILIDAVRSSVDCVLTGALDREGSALIGQRATTIEGHSAIVTSNIAQGLAASEVLIDFTRPEGTMAHLAACGAAGVNLVIGTTGFSAQQRLEIAAASKDIAIVMAPNMSVGVNVTLKLLQLAAQAMSTGYDIEIVEAHHRHKVDAPSGTAIKMGEVMAQAMGKSLQDLAVYSREGHTGERDPSSIGFATIRGGDIVGDHTVLFAGTGERIEISHKASSRAGYALGSLRACRFLAGKRQGMFDMFDVLGL
jgi:4-hydroxy-tetrahydrodipicolinate reductase